MRCPRCYTKLLDEVTHCPDCGLPKPKGVPTSEVKVVATSEEDPKLEVVTVSDEPVEPTRPIYSEKITQAKPQVRVQRAPARPVKQSRVDKRRLFVLVGIPLIVSLVGAAVYLFVLPALQAEQIEAKSAMAAVSRFRSMPSNEDGLTVDERMKKEMEKSRLNGSLRGYQGWIYKPVKGEKTKVLIVFSFEQTDNTQQAEWLADIVRNTYTPQNELAAAIFKR